MSLHLNSELPVWDADEARQRLGGDLEMAHSLLRDLGHQLVSDLQRLQALHAQQHLNALTEEAHRIRGGTAYLGTIALNQALLNLCELPSSSKAPKVDQAMSAVHDEINRLWKFIEKH